MVKKAAYPLRKAEYSPYSRPESKPSLFSKLSSFFYGKNTANSQETPEIINNSIEKTQTLEPSLDHINGTRYHAPNSSFVSNLSSRRSSRSTPKMSRASSAAIDAATPPTPKDKFMQYLQEKGISELEAEGILSMAKRIEDEKLDSVETEQQEKNEQHDNKEVENKETEKHEKHEKSSSVSMFSFSSESPTVIRHRSDTAATPLRMAKRGRSWVVKDSEEGEVSKVQENGHAANDGAKMSSTAASLLDILGPETPEAPTPKKRRYEICINPYSNEKLSKIRASREASREASRVSREASREVKEGPFVGNKLLEKVEQTRGYETPKKVNSSLATSTPAVSQYKPLKSSGLKMELGEKERGEREKKLEREKERVEKEKIDKERVENEKKEKDRLERERLEREKKEQEKEEQEKKEQEKKEQEKNEQNKQLTKQQENTKQQIPSDSSTSIVSSSTALVDSTFQRVFLFPKMLNQRFLDSDVDLSKVEQFKRVFTF